MKPLPGIISGAPHSILSAVNAATMPSRACTAVPRCGVCGYDLSGIGAGRSEGPGRPNTARCPECGAAFDLSTVRVVPDLPGFRRLVWVCLRPACAYLALVLLVGGLVLISRTAYGWGALLALMGPPVLLPVTLFATAMFTSAHYVEKDRRWVVLLMILSSLTASALVAVACSIGLGILLQAHLP